MTQRLTTILVFVAVALLVTSGATTAAIRNFLAHLSGGKEVPPSGVIVLTLAEGQAIFKINDDGSEIRYKLMVAIIDNVFTAHIHKGVQGVNGPISV